MKILALSAGILAALSMVMGLAEAALKFYVLGFAPFSFVILSGTLCQFSIMFMVFDRVYGKPKPKA